MLAPLERNRRYVQRVCVCIINLHFNWVPDNWTRREKILNYCVGVIDASKQEKQTTLESTSDDPRTQRKMQAALFGDETKVRVE